MGKITNFLSKCSFVRKAKNVYQRARYGKVIYKQGNITLRSKGDNYPAYNVVMNGEITVFENNKKITPTIIHTDKPGPFGLTLDGKPWGHAIEARHPETGELLYNSTGF